MNFSLASRYDGLSTDVHKCAPKGNSAGVVLADDAASEKADTALTPEVIAGIFTRYTARKQAAEARGDDGMAERIGALLERLQRLGGAA